ncbi:MAG: hypothetical protein EB006_07685, partial [Betaproteobacteria bacterium]|nr:hypothetical protein [Betaproteobacteria bacterium]
LLLLRAMVSLLLLRAMVSLPLEAPAYLTHQAALLLRTSRLLMFLSAWPAPRPFSRSRRSQGSQPWAAPRKALRRARPFLRRLTGSGV